MTWRPGCGGVLASPPAVQRHAALDRGVWGVSAQGCVAPKSTPVSRGTDFIFVLFITPGRSTALCWASPAGPVTQARPWANLPTLTTAPFTDVGHGTHMLTPPEETQVPLRVRTDCRVCLKAGAPGRAGERRWARPQVARRGEGRGRPLQPQRAPGERAWGPGLAPATRRAAPPHQAATGLWPCPLAQGAGPGSPRGLCGHLRGPSGDPTPLCHPRGPTGALRGNSLDQDTGNRSSENQIANDLD